MRHALDLSNYTGAITPEEVANWRDNADVGAVFVQAVDPPPPYPPSQTQNQCQAVLDAGGVALHAYVFWWFGVGSDFLQRQLQLLDPFVDRLAGLWPDVEDTSGGVAQMEPREVQPPPEALLRIQRQWHPKTLMRISAGLSAAAREDDLGSWLEITDQVQTLMGKSGIYAARWHWGPYMGNTARFSQAGYRLWVASFNQVETLSDWSPFGGWSPPAAAHQYSGTSSVLGVGNVDLNVVDDSLVLLPGANNGADPSAAEFRQALSYLADISQRNAAEIARVARQYGAIP